MTIFIFLSIFSATGEPPLCMSIVIIFALRSAIDAARNESGDFKLSEDFYSLKLPATPEHIFNSTKNMLDHYLLK